MSFQPYTRVPAPAIARSRRPRAVAQTAVFAPGLGLFGAIVLGAATWTALAFAIKTLF